MTASITYGEPRIIPSGHGQALVARVVTFVRYSGGPNPSVEEFETDVDTNGNVDSGHDYTPPVAILVAAMECARRAKTQAEQARLDAQWPASFRLHWERPRLHTADNDIRSTRYRQVGTSLDGLEITVNRRQPDHIFVRPRESGSTVVLSPELIAALLGFTP